MEILHSSGTMLSPQQRRLRNRQEMVDNILAAARAIMREEGVAALNLNEVARRVGLRTPSLYVYFPGKAAIYDAVYLLAIRLHCERMKVAFAEHKEVWDRFRAALETNMAFALEHPELYQMAFERPVPGFAPTEQTMQAALEALNELTVMVRLHLEQGDLAPGVSFEVGYNLMIAMMHGLTTLHAANEPHLPVGSGRYGSLIPAAVSLFKSSWGTNQPGDSS